jgi:hypothetical protein
MRLLKKYDEVLQQYYTYRAIFNAICVTTNNGAIIPEVLTNNKPIEKQASNVLLACLVDLHK